MPHECTDCGRGFEDGSKEMLSGCPSCGGNTFQFKPRGRDTDTAAESEKSPQPPEPPEPEINSTVARTVGSAATAVRDLVGGSDAPARSSEQESWPTAETPEQPQTAERPERPQTAETPTEPTTTGTDTVAEPEQSDSVSRPVESDSNSNFNSKSDSDSGSTSGHPTVSGGTERDQPVEQEPTSSGGITAETTSHEDRAQASARSEVVSPDDLPPAPETPAVRERPAPVVDDHSERDKQDEERPDIDELRKQLNQQFESIRVLAPGQYELNLMELFDREEYIIALQEDGKYTIQVPERWGE